MLDRSALLTKLVYCLRSTSNGLEPVMELNCSHKGSFEKNILSVTVSTACATCAKSSSVIFTKLEG